MHVQTSIPPPMSVLLPVQTTMVLPFIPMAQHAIMAKATAINQPASIRVQQKCMIQNAIHVLPMVKQPL